MGLKKASAGSSYLELTRPLRQETWMQEGNCHWSRRPAALDGCWCADRSSNANPRGISRQQYEMAVALCEICPVQWECVILATEEQQPYCVWAVDPDERRFLRSVPDWQLEVKAAAEMGQSVSALLWDLHASSIPT